MALAKLSERRHVLVVVEREDVVSWKSLRNLERVHVIAPDQLNTYDVLVSDDVVFTEGALASFLGGAADAGRTTPAGQGRSDEAAAKEVAQQTSSDVKAADIFEREADGATTGTEAAEASADEAAGEEETS